jgi:prevent-host-death family protein
MVMIMVMKVARSIKAGEFKAKCLELMDEVARTGQPIVVTKRGTPVAKLCPITATPETLRGYFKDQLEILGDVVAPVDVDWDAAR